MSLLQTKRSAYNRTLFFIIPHFWGMFNKTFFKKQMDVGCNIKCERKRIPPNGNYEPSAFIFLYNKPR